MRVLVADDSIVTRHLLNATLSSWGYDVVLASDGIQAWNILQQPDTPSLAILDWMMPGQTGLDICRRVRHRRSEPYTYLLLLTYKNSKEDLIEGMEAGADDYLVKPFDRHELKVRIRAGTRLIELQTELLAAREALREQATKDFLTRIWNRASILETLGNEMARAERESRPLGIVLADLDHFKSVNDTLGHSAGDAVLRETANRMLHCLRRYDAAGRYGGEEFLILLPGCDEQSTFNQAERLRSSISEVPFEIANSAVLLTASFGCTCGRTENPKSAEALIRIADEALYSAKRLGRNRVEFRSSNREDVPLDLGQGLQIAADI